jgi:hypothetical protein
MQNSSFDYFDKLVKNSEENTKKQVTIYLDDNKLEELDKLILAYMQASNSKSFSRNSLIENAISKFIQESKLYFRQKLGINVDEMEDQNVDSEDEYYDLVILSSTGRGFEETFLGEKETKCWYPCKIKEERIPKLKYIAIYRGQPFSAITHYAKIEKIEYDEEKDAKVCYFDGDPIEVPNKKIPLGKRKGYEFRRPNYITLEKLLSATTADDILKG